MEFNKIFIVFVIATLFISGISSNHFAEAASINVETQCREGHVLVYRVNADKYACVFETTSQKWQNLGIAEQIEQLMSDNNETSPTISAEFPFESHYVEVLGSKMHYIDEGEGDPILFIHGNPTSSYLWRNIIPYVSDDGRVIAVDLIGMGKSDKPDIDYRFVDHAKYLEGFIEELELKNVTLVIHDWGSGLGFNYAMQHEDNIKGIAFMEAIIMPEKWDEFPAEFREIFENFRTPGIGEEMIMTQNIFVEQMLPGGILRELSEAEMNQYREPYPTAESRKPVWMWPNEIPIDGEPADVHKIVTDYNQWLQETEIPKILFYVNPGAILPAPMVEWSEANLKNLETIYVGEGIHFIQEDHPDEIGQGLAEWYQGIGQDLTEETVGDNIEKESMETMVVGALLPLTGERSTRGEDYKTAIHLAERDFNNYLEELGANWTLDIIIEDSATNPVIALEKLTSLKAKNIHIVIGPQSSAELRNVMSYADYNDMLLISSGSTAPTLAIPDDNVYRFIPDDSTQGSVLARLIFDEEITTVVPIWRGDAWGDGLHDVFVKEFAMLGGVTDEGIRYNPETVEFSVSTSLLAEKIQRYSDNNSLEKISVLDMSFTELVQIMQTSSQYDILDDVRWFGASAIVKDSQLVEDRISGKFSEDVNFVAMQFAPSKTIKYDKVQSMMESELGRVPNAYAFSTYDSVWVIGLAILQTQNTEMAAIKEIIPSIAEDYMGVIGSTRLNDAGDLDNSDYEIWGIEDSKWVLVGSYDSDTDSIFILPKK